MIKNIFFIIDIGSSSIKTFIIQKDNSNSNIVGVGKSITLGFNGNSVTNFDDFILAIEKSFSQAKRQAELDVEDGILLMPSHKNNNQLISKSLKIKNSQVENNHIRQLKSSFIFNSEYKNIHCFQSHFTVDNRIITQNPIGITCETLTLNALLTKSNDIDITFYKNIFNKIGVNLNFFYDESIVVFLFLKSLNLHKKNIVYIDIGFNTSKLIIIKNEKILLIKTIKMGSNFITNDIVKILNVSNDFAEKIKISNIDLTISEKKIIEIPVWEELGKNIKRKVDHDYIKLIVSSRLDEIFDLILKNIPQSKFFYSYLITGGGARQKNLKPYINKKFGIDLELMEPKQTPGIPNVLNNSSLMSLFTLNEIINNGFLDNYNILKKNDSFSKKIWYKRIIDLL